MSKETGKRVVLHAATDLEQARLATEEFLPAMKAKMPELNFKITPGKWDGDSFGWCCTANPFPMFHPEFKGHTVVRAVGNGTEIEVVYDRYPPIAESYWNG